MRIALVHDWLVSVRGGERVFQILCDLFPDADVYTFIHDPVRMPGYASRGVRSSFIQRLPLATEHHRIYFPLYPLAAWSTDLRDYDLVIASSSAWAHWVRVGRSTTFVTYCYTPFRYIWSHYEPLIAQRLGPLAPAVTPIRNILRRADLAAANRVDRFIAISNVVQERIRRFYGRDSLVLMPPVDLDLFKPSTESPGDYFLMVSAFRRYKRLDIAIKAFTALKLPLKVVGTGEDESYLRSIASDNVEFLGRRPDAEIARLYAGCRAFVFTSEEDYGITPLEAMASGRPVIAYGAGGVLETVVDGLTGCLYGNQSAEALIDVVRAGHYDRMDPRKIRNHVEQFGIPAFGERLTAEINRCVAAGKTGDAPARATAIPK